MAILRDLDKLLRGGFTHPDDLKAGRLETPLRTLLLGGLLLGGAFGAFMGLYASTRTENPSFLQLLSSVVKVPLLFILTLIVTVPSLYVVSALARSPLRFKNTLRLLLSAIAINLALLASLGPVVGFFTLSTSSYPFMVALNVMFFAVSGIAGLVFLQRALGAIFDTESPKPHTPPEGDPPKADPSTPPEDQGPTNVPGMDKTKPPPASPKLPYRAPPRLPPPVTSASLVFRAWILIYGVVGAQMGWILRPFVGDPRLPFELFRTRESSFFGGLAEMMRELFH